MKYRMKESYRKGVANRPDLEFCVDLSRGKERSVNRGTGGQGIELRKPKFRAPTRWTYGEGKIQACASARMSGALRSRRPQARQETSCTRTGRPPNYLHTEVEQSGL